MSAMAAARLGYEVAVFDPEPGCPAGVVAADQTVAAFDDVPALEKFASSVDVMTFEFENVRAAPLAALEAVAPVRPSATVLRICQNRRREKEFLRGRNFPCARFEVVDGVEALRAALHGIHPPAVLKTADFGYDGKGQLKIEAKRPAEELWSELGAPLAVLEEWVEYETELSVVCARWADGTVRCFPAIENHHRNHILDVSICPGRFPRATGEEAQRLAAAIAGALELVGLLAVEFFLTRDGRLLVNELAPRPHNSGHLTADACITGQFEQHVRAVCNLPPGDPSLLRPAVMVNLLGDLWKDGAAPDWQALLDEPSAKLHLYGKRAARPGRKMGHCTLLEPTLEECLQTAQRVRDVFGLPTLPVREAV